MEMPFKHMLRDLPAWRQPGAAAKVAFIDRLKTRSRTGGPSTWVNVGRISPLELYCYLKVRFGEPNGLMTALRVPSTDNVVHWDYLLMHNDAFLTVMATQRRLEFALHADYGTSADDWNLLIDQLEADFTLRKAETEQVRNGLERWFTFVNPFRRLELILINLQKQLDAVDLTPVPPLTAFAVTRDALRDYCDRREDFRRRVVDASTIGFSIRVLAPIMGEAFVNFLVLALARDEIRNDSSLLESALRARIDVRVKSLSVTCNYFARKIDPAAQPVRDFFRLMNGRNELLHGSVDPKSLAVDEVFFDHRTIPLFRRDMSALDRSLDASLRFIEPARAREDLAAVNGFVAFVLTQIQDNHRPAVDAVLHSSFPGYRPDTRRVGLLFSETIVESFMGGGADDAAGDADTA